MAQGLCLPACRFSAECAPTLDPRVAAALYLCNSSGACELRCTVDLQCGSANTCDRGSCRKADCTTATDCRATEYCSSATSGRCLPFTPCTTDAQCPTGFGCGTLGGTSCPPGFDCTQRLCVERPTCLADRDCEGLLDAGTGYCELGHCQPTPRCSSSADCSATGHVCIAARCVPSVCRGFEDCPAAQRCLDGACARLPPNSEIALLRLTAARSITPVGAAVHLELLGSTFTGQLVPVKGDFEALGFAGQPIDAGTFDGDDFFTPTVPGPLRIRATLTGSATSPVEVPLVVLPLATGARLVVVAAASEQPLLGAEVTLCTATACLPPRQTDDAGTTSLEGIDGGLRTITVTHPETRSDGRPRYEWASLLAPPAGDLLLPLRDNPAFASAGVNASVSVDGVSSAEGDVWVGAVLASATDLSTANPARLLGDTFTVSAPNLSLGVGLPIPEAAVLFTAGPILGTPQDVKARAYAHAEPGQRLAVAFAGRASTAQLLSIRSLDLLSYASTFDVDISSPLEISERLPHVADATDIDGDALCSVPMRCPAGSEDIADYARFTRASLRPLRQQRLRAEVQVANVSGPFTTVLVAAVSAHERFGTLPLGFASTAPTASGVVAPMTVQCSSPFAGLEGAPIGLWTVAFNGQGQSSARLSRGARLPERHLESALLPALSTLTLDVGARSLSTAPAAWAAAHQAGGVYARATVTGRHVRHVLYFASRPDAATIAWPQVGAATPNDPLREREAHLELVLYQLDARHTPATLLLTHHAALLGLNEHIVGYTRLER